MTNIPPEFENQPVSKTASRRSPVVELTLPGERLAGGPLSFKVPPLENLAASANRLLKFEFPVSRNRQVHERLIKANLISARLSKKTLEELPVPAIERIYHAIWQEAFGPAGARAEVLTLLLLAEELLEFNAEALVKEDIRGLGLHETAGLHSYYYSGEVAKAPLLRLLSENNYRTDLLEAAEESDPAAVQRAYLACRRLTSPLPWDALLSELDNPMRERFPQLARLCMLHEALEREGWYRPGALAPENFGEIFQGLTALLSGPVAQAVASRGKTARPVKELILVEGETEKMLLPLFAESMGADFNALGIFVMPAGGKNHVMSLYKQHANILGNPIFVVLDGDASEVVSGLQEVLRPQDFVYQIQEGEFEDTYDLRLILQTINQHYQPYPEVTPQTFTDESMAGQGRVQILKAIWQSYNLGSFDKVEFAGKLAEMIRPNMPPPEATRTLLETILKVRRGL